MTSAGLTLSGNLIEAGWQMLSDLKTMALAFRSNGFPTRLIVTFDQLSAFNHSRPRVSGDQIVLACNADHLHLSTSETTWYQSPEIFQALPIARRLCEKYSEVILYGHSMGGYAALLFSGSLNATNVVSFAPQYSVDPQKVPFENRFTGFVKDIAFMFDDMDAAISKTAPKYVVYDPYTEIDRKHVDLLIDQPGIIPVRIPFAGHLPGEFLKEAGCIRETIIDLLLDRPNAAQRRTRMRSGRRRSHRYFLERASHIARRGRLMEALDLVNAAYVLDPESLSVIQTYHALLMCKTSYFGISHALVRLIMYEKPEWTHFAGSRDHIWHELKKLAEPIIRQPI